MADHAAMPCRRKLWTGRPRCQFEQFTVDLGSAPQRVLKTHSPDELAHLSSRGRPPGERDLEFSEVKAGTLSSAIDMIGQEGRANPATAANPGTYSVRPLTARL